MSGRQRSLVSMGYARRGGIRIRARNQTRTRTRRVRRDVRGMQLFVTKDAQGNRVDRDYSEHSIRTQWSMTNPNDFVEPTSRANLTSWIVPRLDDSTYPVPDVNPRGLVSIAFAGTDTAAVNQLKNAQCASFIATRYGLCRIRNRKYTVSTYAEPQNLADIIPWGASSTYLNPLWSDNSNHPIAAQTYFRPSQQWPWRFAASGCLPIFYMDQPNPYMKPLPGVLRDEGRFGDSVRSKFRELDITIEEFPYCGRVLENGKWSAQSTAALQARAGLQVMPERPIDHVRIIIFTRKKDRRNPDVGQQPLMPPIFPPAPAGSFCESDALPLDSTWDTPAHGEHVMRWPSKHPASPYVIIEDVVMQFPKFKPTGVGMYSSRADNGAPSVGAGSHDATKLFKGYGTATASHAEVDGTEANARATMPHLDADGLPHTNRKLRFRRKYKDMGNKVIWHKKGMINTHEGLDDGIDQYNPALPDYLNTDPRMSQYFTTGVSPGTVDIDMCDRKLFVTVLTGAYLECREQMWVTTGGTETTSTQCEGISWATFNNQFGRSWHISPASVCHPALVSIKTKWHYADEALQGRPDQMRVVDDTGATIGRIVVDRPDPYAPGEVEQT